MKIPRSGDAADNSCLGCLCQGFNCLSRAAGVAHSYVPEMFGRRGIQFTASIDHAVWFHRPARVDEWLLYVMDSPSASSGRGFTRASIFARNGHLVASTAQESLIRVRRSGRRQKVARLLI